MAEFSVNEIPPSPNLVNAFNQPSSDGTFPVKSLPPSANAVNAFNEPSAGGIVPEIWFTFRLIKARELGERMSGILVLSRC
jgi:hypothetical protein